MSDELNMREETGEEPAGEGVPAAAGAGCTGGDVPAPSDGTVDGAHDAVAGEPVPVPAAELPVSSGTQEPATEPHAAPDSGTAQPSDSGREPAAETAAEQDAPPAEAAVPVDRTNGEAAITEGMEARALREVYPDFDMEREMQDPAFRNVITGAVRPTIRQAYELCHRDALEAQAVHDAVETAVRRAEENLLAHIRARGQRPQENGTSDMGAVQTHPNVDRLTRSERAALAKRAAQGEHILL